MNQKRIRLLKQAIGPEMAAIPNFWRYVKKLWKETPEKDKAKLMRNLKQMRQTSQEIQLNANERID